MLILCPVVLMRVLNIPLPVIGPVDVSNRLAILIELTRLSIFATASFAFPRSDYRVWTSFSIWVWNWVTRAICLRQRVFNRWLTAMLLFVVFSFLGCGYETKGTQNTPYG